MKDDTEYRGYMIRIMNEDCPLNPRTDWDNFGKMWCWHNRYALGDEDDEKPKSKDFNGFEEIREYIEEKYKALVILPIFMYDHSGISISTGRDYPFNDRWDAGQIGYIFATKKDIEENYEGRTDEVILKDVEEHLVSEVKTYDEYLCGEVYGYSIIEKKKCECCGHTDEIVVDSCSGYYGESGRKYALEEAKNFIDSIYNAAIAEEKN